MRASMLLVAVATALLAFLATSVEASSFLKHYSRTVRYDGEKIYECSFAKASATGKHGRQGIVRFIEDEFDVWDVKSESFSVRATPEKQYKHKSFLNKACTVAVNDVEELVREWEADMVDHALKNRNAEYFEDYHTYEEVTAWYQDLANQYPNWITFIPSIGETIEGRAQPAIIVSTTPGTRKPSIYLQSQIHAREWISNPTLSYIVNQLVSTYNTSADAKLILDSVNLYVVPFTNPDGYVYTWNGDRLWRKNRNPNSGNCFGVDVNRNYDTHWGEGGSSNLECSDTYMGENPNSELESQNTFNFFKTAAPVIGSIDWHSYGQLILRPYGWTDANSPHEAQLKSIGDGIRDEILDVHDVQYTSQKSIALYVTTGTASDFYYDDLATATNGGYRSASFTIELRDEGRYGFRLPATEIIPTGEENYAGFILFAKSVIANPIVE